MRIGLFGGTFNPPHIGHVRAADRARQELSLDRVVFIPASIPPHKAIPDGTPPPEVRLRLTQAAVEGYAWAEVSGVELERTGVSYTADTVKTFSSRYPDAELWLLVGSDNFLGMHGWYHPEVIFSLCSAAVFAREPGLEVALAAQQRKLYGLYRAKTAIVALEPTVISSTELRDGLRRGQGADYLPPSVAEHIRKLGLYENG